MAGRCEELDLEEGQSSDTSPLLMAQPPAAVSVPHEHVVTIRSTVLCAVAVVCERRQLQFVPEKRTPSNLGWMQRSKLKEEPAAYSAMQRAIAFWRMVFGIFFFFLFFSNFPLICVFAMWHPHKGNHVAQN